MNLARVVTLAVLGVLASISVSPVQAQGFHEVGEGIRAHEDPDDFSFELHGYFRGRGEILSNLDLDRGLTPSGDPLFPVPADDPEGQNLYEADMRLRTDLSIYAPGGSVAIHTRLDVLDNLAVGSTPDDIPAATVGQRTLDNALHLRRACGLRSLLVIFRHLIGKEDHPVPSRKSLTKSLLKLLAR